MPAMLTVLIIGGYGTFGGRVVELLADDERLRIIVAGRSLDKARLFCRRPARAGLEPLALDRSGAAAALASLEPDLVIDASGPWQSYGAGADPYALVRACIAAGADYADLADATSFVHGIGGLDGEARAAGRFALSGLSTYPVLSAAAVRRLARGLASVESIVSGIAPSPHAGVGPSVVAAIASYAGAPVTIRLEGRSVVRHAFIDSRRAVIDVPGHVPLKPVRFALLDVPDHALLAADWPQARTIWLGAGPTPASLHRMLSIAAWLVRLRLLPSLTPLAGLMNRAINLGRWGEPRGGMFVEIAGRAADGRPERKGFHLTAPGDSGPYIPSMAAAALVRRLLDDRRPQPGARSGHHDLELDDYAPLLAARGIAWGIRAPGPDPQALPIYRLVMGEAFARTARPIQDLHDLSGRARYAGRARVTRGKGLVSRVIGAVMAFPPACEDGPVEVSFVRQGPREVWRRAFGTAAFSSTQEAGRGQLEGLVVERFGPLAFAMAATEEQGRLMLVLRRWSAFGVTLPLALGPRMTAYEHDADGRFNFHVDVALPLLGRIVRYEGWLERVD